MQWNEESVVGRPGIICFALRHLFKGDGVHLSPEGCSIYLTNLARGIKIVLYDVGGQGESLGCLLPSMVV